MRLVVWLGLFFVGCAAGMGDPGGGARDGGPRLDAGPRPDVGPLPDTGALDTGLAVDSGPAPDAGPAPTFEPYRILSVNLHCFILTGTRYTSNAERWNAIADVVMRENVGVVALQEACDRDGESASESLRAAIEARTGATWYAAWVEAHLAWEGTPDEAREGLAIITRGAPLVSTDPLVHSVQGSLRRVVLLGHLPLALGGARLAVVHFDHLDEPVRISQAREAANALLVASDPGFDGILAGDVNARAGDAPHSALLAAGLRDATGSLPADRIDHLLVHRAGAIDAIGARTILTGADAVSDHPALIAELAPRDRTTVVVTRVDARVDVGFGRFVALRGSVAPLDWERGWPMRNLAPDRWRLVTTEIATGFEYKTLRDDTTWQMGDNAIGVYGADNEVVPRF